MTGRIMLIVGTGGFLGSVARYLTATYFTKLIPSTFPYGTFAANVVGCLIIGLVYGLPEKYSWLTPELRIFLTVGFCGGYTTFSSFAYENVQFIQNSQYLILGLYSLVSYTIGLLAVFVDLSLTKM